MRAAILTVLALFAGCFFPRLALADSPEDQAVCRADGGFSVRASIKPPTDSVLLVPLLKASPEANEKESWPKHPAARLAAFYHGRFGIREVWLNQVRTWKEFFRKADRLRQQGMTFDRIILIGHGGYDGPILNPALVRNELSVSDPAAGRPRGRFHGAADSRVETVRILEEQPGLVDELIVSHDASRNHAFNAALAERWHLLAKQPSAEITEALTELETRFEPPDPECLDRVCPAGNGFGTGERDLTTQRRACQSVCRVPLFLARSALRPDPERFSRFAESLRALAKPEGLIVIGSCNPGTPVPETEPAPWDTAGLLARSSLAGGPHATYVHLLAAGTGRFVAGPIGRASGDDIVRRVELFETRRAGRLLRIAAPPTDCTVGSGSALPPRSVP